MKDAEDIDVTVLSDDVGNSVVLVKQNPDITLGPGISLADLWKPCEVLCPVVYPLDSASGCGRIIRSDVLVDVFYPPLRFFGPSYFCHERMRRPISSFEIVRFASESDSPRSTIT